jgi:crotonobetainyl-CoA:carnitine CoA-transferase CaiB-like acyl-CoA transferase
VAARYLNEAGAEPPARGMLELAGGLACYRPYECADGGWVALGALEPKFWETWCRGAGREDLLGEQFAAPGSAGHAAVTAVFAQRTRAEWEAFAVEHECCLEPVLELGEALSSPHVGEREMVVGLDQPGASQPVSLLGAPVKLSRTPADCNRRPGPQLGEHTEAVLRAAGYDEAAIERLVAAGAVAGPPDDAEAPAGSFLA